MNTTKTSRAFTLIELLVVIATVVLLFAVSGPSFGMTRKRAEEAICRSTLRQWALVFTLYAADNEESFPQSIASPTSPGVTPEAAWILGALLPYYEDLDLRDCPSTGSLNRSPSTSNVGGTFIQWGPFPPSINGAEWWTSYAQGSYGFNEWTADPPPGADTFWGSMDSDLAIRTTFEKDASLIPVVFDSVWLHLAPRMINRAPTNLEHAMDTYPTAHWWSSAMQYICIDRHSGGINAAFVDMGVRHVGVKELWLLKWHKNWTPCMPPNAWPSWMGGHKDYDDDW
jgi:prepilin-type processing-associated H-X9-DG protein